MVRVRASFDYEDQQSGDTKTAVSTWVAIGNSVTRTELKLELATEYYVPMKPTDINGNVQPFNVTYRVFGSVQKTLFLKIDGGSELKYDYAASVDSVPQTVQASGNQYLTHGIHKVEAWLQCEDGLGNTITSDKLVNRFMMVADESNTQPYLMLQNVDGMIDNFVQTEIAEYAVYAPNVEKVDVAFLLTTYTTDYETSKPSEYFRLEQSVVPQTPNKLLTTVEIEAENDASAMDTYNTYFRVRRMDGTSNTDFMKESTGETSYLVIVDNTNAMTPVSGATFLMNPKVRNNNEANPKTILNAKNNNAVVESVWTNIGLINDGWMTDDEGNKVLRIMAGGTLEIKKNIWAQFRTNPNSSLTFEIDCKISNVTNTTDPIIQMFSGTASTFRGLKMNALEGWLKNGTEQSSDDTLFAWQEDVRTHFSFNLNHQVFPNKGDVKYASEDATKANGSIALARVLVNGDCVRELKYDTTKVDEWSSSDEGSIIIGNEGADIDIYSIRVYENKQLDTIDILTRNYLASLPKADDKLALKQKNDLLDGGLISVEKTKNAKLNTMIWHGILPYKNNSSEQTGWIEIYRYDADGNYLADLSGTICKQTKSLGVKGQGSTAKTYYDWNVQDDSSKVKATILVAIKDFHESISIRIDGDKAYIKGGNLGKNFPLEETEVAYPYANGYVTVPDGWIDGNGKYRGMGYMVAYGTALAQKRVIKINYASSMQSHLIGACKTYDLLHRKVVGDTPLQERVPSAVAAKHTEPFMYFNQEGDGRVYFKGMGTYGAGKADKVAWGFVKKQMPMYALIEGSDNNLPMTGFRVPFDKNTAVYDCDGEGWLYNGVQNFDFDLGNTELYSDATQQGEGWQFVNTDANDGEVPSKAIRDKWADIHNFIYLHSTNLKFFDGTFEQFQESSAAQDTNYKYWCTQGSDAYKLKRYDYIGKSWMDAGLLGDNNIYASFTLSLNGATSNAYKKWVSDATVDFNALNDAFREALMAHMKKYLKYFINEKSLQFNYCYVLGFLAGTDNSDKNTYYKIMPYAESFDADPEFETWVSVNMKSLKNGAYTTAYQLYFDGDDMDSILRTDNNSHLTKPYYIDRLHPYADEKPNDSLYEGMGNQLFNYVELAYEGTNELASVMNQIMIAATELIDESDTKGDKLVGGKSLWGFLNKYFFNIQRYFPQIAYLEQARIRYEFPELLGYISSGGGARSIRPITQSLGSQLQAELQYMNQRVIYMTSYAGFGAWGGDSTHSIGLSDANETFGFMPAALPDGGAASYTFTIKPHQYIYPSFYEGQTFTQTHKRTSPKKTCTFSFTHSYTSGDTGVGICGVNYISDLGDLGNVSVTTALIISGKRLTQICSSYNAKFKPSSITINAINSTNISLNRANNGQITLDCSKLIRTRIISLGYVFNGVLLPESSNLQSIILTIFPTEIKLNNIPNLSTFTIQPAERQNLLTKIHIGKNVGTNTGFSFQSFIKSVYKEQTQSSGRLQSIHVENINWDNFDAEALAWLADRPICELYGRIGIAEGINEYQTAVTWDMKNKFIEKFGDIDTGNGNLTLDYRKRNFEASTAKIKGNFFVDDYIVRDKGYNDVETFDFSVTPESNYMNTQTKIQFSLEGGNTSAYSMSADGKLLVNVYQLSDKQNFATVKASITQYENGSFVTENVTKKIEIWNRPAQVGDVVYYDGSYGSAEEYDEGGKTAVGVCCYVAPRNEDGSINATFHNPEDKMKRFMTSLQDIKLVSDTEEMVTIPYGVYARFDTSDRIKNSLYTLAEDGSYKELEINGRALNDILDYGFSSQYHGGYFEDKIFDNSDIGMANGGFKPVDAKYDLGDGFAYNESSIELVQRILDDGLAKLAGENYHFGDIVNSGYAKTLKIIQRRTEIITYSENNTINGVNIPLRYQSSNDEFKTLADSMSEIKTWAKSDTGFGDANYKKWEQIYFPAASACYAYEPKIDKGEVLSNKFLKHNWFLPTFGLLVRLWAYCYQYKDNISADRENSPFLKVFTKKIATKPEKRKKWSTSMINKQESYGLDFRNGYGGLVNACLLENDVRPICAF